MSWPQERAEHRSVVVVDLMHSSIASWAAGVLLHTGVTLTRSLPLKVDHWWGNSAGALSTETVRRNKTICSSRRVCECVCVYVCVRWGVDVVVARAG